MNDNQTATEFTTGNQVKVTGYPDSPYNERVGTYKYPSVDGVSHLIWFADNDEAWLQTRFLRPFVHEPINRYTPPPSYEVLRESHAELERKVALLERKVESLSTQVENGHKAVEIIGNRLISESDDRQWCEEFDRIIDEVNEMLPGSYQLPTREREYEVEWTDMVQVPVGRSVTVRARNEEEAREMAASGADSISTSEIVEAVRYGNWEVDEYSDPEYYVTEV